MENQRGHTTYSCISPRLPISFHSKVAAGRNPGAWPQYPSKQKSLPYFSGPLRHQRTLLNHGDTKQTLSPVPTVLLEDMIY